MQGKANAFLPLRRPLTDSTLIQFGNTVSVATHNCSRDEESGPQLTQLCDPARSLAWAITPGDLPRSALPQEEDQTCGAELSQRSPAWLGHPAGPSWRVKSLQPGSADLQPTCPGVRLSTGGSAVVFSPVLWQRG